MQPSIIKAAVRSTHGKGNARKLRATGRIPAIVYGLHAAPLSVALDPHDIVQLRGEILGWNTPIALSIDGGDDVPLALLRDVQRHPLTGAVLHVDFQRVVADRPVDVSIRIDLEGRSKGVALGGRMQRPIRRVTVRCLPGRIPEAIVLDVADMEIGDKVMVDELPIPEGAAVLFQDRVPVISLVGRRGGAFDDDEDEDEETEETEETEEAEE
jgi:large subunit ribosomal protein L25